MKQRTQARFVRRRRARTTGLPGVIQAPAIVHLLTRRLPRSKLVVSSYVIIPIEAWAAK